MESALGNMHIRMGGNSAKLRNSMQKALYVFYIEKKTLEKDINWMYPAIIRLIPNYGMYGEG